LKITLDHKKSQEISETVHSTKLQKREELHLSDAVYCPIKAYNRMTGLEGTVSRKTAAYFTIGKALHIALEGNFESKEVVREIKNPTKGLPDYQTHIDVVEGKEPIEFKTTRKKIRTEKDLAPTWIKQLTYECVFSNSKVGWLCVLEVITALVTVWKLELEANDLELARIELMKKFQLIEWAIRDENPHLLEIPNSLRWMCRDCLYKVDCPRRPGI